MLCRFISYNKHIILVGEAMRVGGRWENSVPSAQFCCEPQTALQNKGLFFFKFLKG